MGFAWIFGYIAAFTDVETLWYIYIILNSLQGVFIFISFICKREVGLLWIQKLRLSGLVERTPGRTPITSTSDADSRNIIDRSVSGTNVTAQQNPGVHFELEKEEGQKPMQSEVRV